MKSNISIRSATDITRDVLTHSVEVLLPQLVPDILEQLEGEDWIDDLYSGQPHSWMAIAFMDEQPVGLIAMSLGWRLVKQVGYIEYLVIDKRWRSQGIGKILLDNARNYATRQNIDRLTLLSETFRTRAHRFYEKNEFTSGTTAFRQFTYDSG
jgi:GNAT superfamily N-acetyltransferase